MGRRPGVDGRELLLAAALKLFAHHGIDGISIRAVNREAGLGPASVHYHFGTKEALLEAVIASYGDAVIEKTKARAQAILVSEAPASARDLVTMMVEPYLDLMANHTQDGHAWVRIMSNLLQSDPKVLDRPSTRLMWTAASKVYPDASPEMVRRAIRMCLTLLVTQIAHAKQPVRSSSKLDLDMLTTFLAAGLDGALRSPTHQETARIRAS